MLFEVGYLREDFLVDKFLGGLADQALIIIQIRGSENVFGTAGSDEECAAAIQNLRNGCRGHEVPPSDELCS